MPQSSAQKLKVRFTEHQEEIVGGRRSERFCLRPDAIWSTSAHAKFIISSEDESTWNDSYHRGILLAPIATFDPQGRAGSGSWKIQQKPRIDVGDVGVEVICTKADAWYYCGTYNCVYSSLLSFKQASQISVSVRSVWKLLQLKRI